MNMGRKANWAIIDKFIKRDGTESPNQTMSGAAMRGTAILITVSVTFIVLNGPYSGKNSLRNCVATEEDMLPTEARLRYPKKFGFGSSIIKEGG